MTTDVPGRLQDLLNDLIQFESKELDVGIYHNMNHKRGEMRVGRVARQGRRRGGEKPPRKFPPGR